MFKVERPFAAAFLFTLSLVTFGGLFINYSGNEEERSWGSRVMLIVFGTLYFVIASLLLMKNKKSN